MLRRFLKIWILLILLTMGGGKVEAEPRVALSLHGDIKYKPGQPFSYVNPTAPKGGRLILGAVGTFNTLNPFGIKGEAPLGLTLTSERVVFESLMTRAADEPFTLYGLLAEKIEIAENNQWITFHINPKARWADGMPVTADDVLFSYHILSKEGKLVLQLHYSQVEKAEKLSPLAVKFTFKLKDGYINREMPLIVSLMPVLPHHVLKDKDFSTVDFRKVPGTGAYTIQTAVLGKEIIYKRNPNYWGKDLPIRQGFYNFDILKIIYFFEHHLPLEAFKAGAIDYMREPDPIMWQRNYTFLPHQKQIKKIEYQHQTPMGMEGIVLNTRSPLFKDRRIRQALGLLFSFDHLNKNLYGATYQPYRSFFENSDLAHGPSYTGDEKKIIHCLPPSSQAALEQSAKEQEYFQSLVQRQKAKLARDLLKEAGWILQKGRLLHFSTQQPFVFEMCISKPDHQRIALYFREALKKMGIQVIIRFIDSAQYEKRLRDYDFDTIIHLWGQSLSPGNEQQRYWSTHAAHTPGSRNHAGIQDPDVDYCCDLIATAETRQRLQAAVKVLDRLLLKGAYVIPLGYNKLVYGAYASHLEHPPLDPRVGILLSTWWHKPLSSHPKGE